jgi:hypothetical protein
VASLRPGPCVSPQPLWPGRPNLFRNPLNHLVGSGVDRRPILRLCGQVPASPTPPKPRGPGCPFFSAPLPAKKIHLMSVPCQKFAPPMGGTEPRRHAFRL